jgi:hypothetical protein
MDDYELTQQEKWNDKKKDDHVLNTLLPALMILFDTVEPLTFDCISTKEEIEQRDEDIFEQIEECRRVINNLDKGAEQYQYMFTQSLVGLLISVKPLLFRCLYANKEEQDKFEQETLINIKNHANYCEDVSESIEKGYKPVTFDDFMNGKRGGDGNRRILTIKTQPPQTKEELEELKNSLSNMFDNVLGNN